ncbi:hypothetical protein EJB05_54227, partial [Eragrostis curvula]
FDIGIDTKVGQGTPHTSLRRVHARPCGTLPGAHEHHMEWATATAEVVTAGHSAEHRRSAVYAWMLGRGKLLLVAGDGVPDDEFPHGFQGEDQHTAVAAVEGPRAGAAERRRGQGGGRRGGDESDGHAVIFVFVEEVAEEAEQRRRPVELAVPAEEGGVGEEAEPGFADEGGADEVVLDDALAMLKYEI